MSDAGGTRYDLSVKRTINALVSEAKALKTQIEIMTETWTLEFGLLMILNEDDVNFEHEIEQSAIKYTALQNTRNKLKAKKDEINNLLGKNNSDKKNYEQISLGNQLMLKEILSLGILKEKWMKAQEDAEKRRNAVEHMSM